MATSYHLKLSFKRRLLGLLGLGWLSVMFTHDLTQLLPKGKPILCFDFPA